MARPFGFFNSIASLKPAFSTATGTSTDHFSYFARTLNDHFLLPPSGLLSIFSFPPRSRRCPALDNNSCITRQNFRCRAILSPASGTGRTARADVRPLPIRSRPAARPTARRKDPRDEGMLRHDCPILPGMTDTHECVATISYAPLDEGPTAPAADANPAGTVLDISFGDGETRGS